jgi:heme-degrading monooxygenase HmoA
MEREARDQLDDSFDSLFPYSNDVAGDRLQRRIWNVRVVGFISKPERTDELVTVIENAVNDRLPEFPGFAGAMVLRSQNEKRTLLVFSFWETEKQAATTRWEVNRGVRRAISQMVDVCIKVQTFQATAAAGSGTTNRKPTGMCAVACA